MMEEETGDKRCVGVKDVVSEGVWGRVQKNLVRIWIMTDWGISRFPKKAVEHRIITVENNASAKIIDKLILGKRICSIR